AACLAAGYGQSGVPFGHPEYLAPEVVQERLPRPTPRTDVYALGITLYELCCGHVPHRGSTHKETLRRHFDAPLPPPPEEVHVSTALAEVILRLTAKDPKRRPADMKVALHGLEEYRRARLAGHTSDGIGESQKDVAKDAISKNDWASQSAVEGEVAGGWTAQAVESAEQVGPDLGGDEESFEPGEHRAVNIARDAKAAAAAVSKKKGCLGVFFW
ncbi:MAG: protein kinase, partial [Planctomycetota bacterium]